MRVQSPAFAPLAAMTRERIYIDTMQQVYTSTSKVMLDAKGSGAFNAFPVRGLNTVGDIEIITADLHYSSIQNFHCCFSAVAFPSN